MIIFDTKTYAELGVKGGSALLKLTIVNKAGQLPWPSAAHGYSPHPSSG